MPITLELHRPSLEDLRADATNAEILFESTWKLAGENLWGIAGNTFRGFQKHAKPSHQYRAWAPQMACYLDEVPDQQFDLRLVHQHLADDLQRHWANDVKQLSVAHCFKIVDLFMLHMARCAELGAIKRRILVRHANPALDKFTLTGLAKLVPGVAVGDLAMGSVEDLAQYQALQRVIEQIASQAALPRLYFDVWCWPDSRRRANGLPPSSLHLNPILMER